MDAEFVKSAYRKEHYPPQDRPDVAFAGRSNVGKSSLLNVLVNRKKLARASSRPGRTQALNFFLVDRSLYLVDLPGYGFARVAPDVKKSWGKMVETYLRNRNGLKAVVVILDIRRDVSEGDLILIRWLYDLNIYPILVLTKADKVNRQTAVLREQAICSQLKGLSPGKLITFSAKTKRGKEEIWQAINDVTGIGSFQGHRP